MIIYLDLSKVHSIHQLSVANLIDCFLPSQPHHKSVIEFPAQPSLENSVRKKGGILPSFYPNITCNEGISTTFEIAIGKVPKSKSFFTRGPTLSRTCLQDIIYHPARGEGNCVANNIVYRKDK